jgi:hypothetical protein
MRCIYCGTRTDTHLPLCTVKLQATIAQLERCPACLMPHGALHTVGCRYIQLELENAQLRKALDEISGNA